MRKNFVFSLVLLGILGSGWAIMFFQLPFYQMVLIAGGASLVIMTLIHERFVFLYAVIMALSFGAFLTVDAFMNDLLVEDQILYMYSHLLFTSFLLLFWILLNLLKNTGYENIELKRQVQLLQKYNGNTQVLTVPEFKEQATWLLKAGERNGEEAWLLKINLVYPNKRTKENLMEKLETAALRTIRQKFDLVTSDSGIIFVLLKNTHVKGVERVLERFWEKAQLDVALNEPPYTTQKGRVVDAGQLARLMGEKS